VGLSFQAGTDVPDSQAPFPSTFAEQQCASIYAAGGITFKDRTEARLPFGVCDAVLFLKAAMDRAGKVDITPAVWGAAAAGLGTEYQASSNYSTFLGPTRVGGPAAARPMSFDAACSCMKYTGPEQPLGGVPASATTTTGAGA
jgi:hypothetical protein